MPGSKTDGVNGGKPAERPGREDDAGLVKLNLSRSLVDTLHEDIAAAIATLEEKGPVSQSERKRVKTSVTH